MTLFLINIILALVWTVDPCAPQAHWAEAPDRVFVGITEQGEAISFDGPQTLLITSEGSPMPVLSTRCRDWRPPTASECVP